FGTPEQVPFLAGTYFPPEQIRGMPSWRMVLEAVAASWREKREQIDAQSGGITERLAVSSRLRPSQEPIDGRALDRAVAALRSAYDPVNGGFGGAPKFPASSVIELLLARGEREMSIATLRA